MADGDVLGLGLVEADESAAAELARLRDVMQRFPAPREGSSLHLEALEGRCVAHSFTVVPSRPRFIHQNYYLQVVNNSSCIFNCYF